MGLASGGSNKAFQETFQAGNTEAKGAGLGGPAGNLAGDDQKNAFAFSEGLSFNEADTRQRSDSDIHQNATGGTVFGSDNETNVVIS